MKGHGILRGIAWRPADGDAMAEVQQCEVLPGRGICTENRKAGKREITLISQELWQQTCAELGTTLPWHARRANLLIEGLDFGRLVGHEITIGDQVRICIHGETKPCGIMDKQHDGLRKSLEPNLRGGVFGQVLTGGIISVGQAVMFGHW